MNLQTRDGGKTVRIYLDDAETGHAKVVSVGPRDVEVEIANVPMGGKYNLGDIVLARPDQYDILVPFKLVARKYSTRTDLSYAKIAQYRAFVKAAEKAGGACEGFGRGYLSCSHNDLDLRPLANKHGMTIENQSSFARPNPRRGLLDGWWDAPVSLLGIAFVLPLVPP